MTSATRLEAFTVIKDGEALYYLLKVVRQGFDVYCIPPNLGVHYSLHNGGKGHFRFEGGTPKVGQELPVALVEGEAGSPFGGGIIRAPLRDLGRATGICTAVYSIDALSTDFQTFHRSVRECFVIDQGLFAKESSFVEVGVWAVPARNEISFEFNNPNIPEELLYKITSVEPQIWIYAKPIGD
jgi:hypothetical protein